VEVLRRYVVDYTNGHDPKVIPSIIHQSYRFMMSGTAMGYEEYVSMVDSAFGYFPDLDLVVHDLFTNGDRLAMWFSERASSRSHGGREAVWQGVSLYRWNGVDMLTECVVEQDFYGRRQQLASGIRDTVEPTMMDPWSVDRMPPNDRAQAVVTSRLLDLAPPHIDPSSTTVEDIFSAGQKVAFKVRWDGTYSGGIFGVDESRQGSDTSMDATGVATVTDGTMMNTHMVLDRYGLRHRLRT
jgi:predicted ester cyclase